MTTVRASRSRSCLDRMLSDEAAEPKPLPLSLLVDITNGFSYKMEIGSGGFALVYKGILENGVVAVKRLLSTAYMNEKEFHQEIGCLMKVKHKNIVRFLGYCADTQGNMDNYKGKLVMANTKERLFCFEFLPNGGLDRYIKDPTCGLEWGDRFDIIKGICEGLHHLHQINILHLDLKPANILLDENMEPKITDFGISRSFDEGQTRVIATKMIGTPGYMAPECESNLITKKYDLYSLGVIIMEIVTGGKRCQGVETVLKSWSDRLNISQRNQECEQIQVCVEIGIQCKESDPQNRPDNMKHIIEKLAETERIKEILLRIKMLDIGITSSSRSLHSLDTNQAKQWIITGEDKGHVRIWNYQQQKKVDSLKLSERSEVVCIKFIARKQWFAAASGYNIYVYSYETKMQKITSIKAGSSEKSLHTLAVHPTKLYLLSSDYGNIKLWNWDKNWECTHIFEANNIETWIYQIALSSKGTIAGASLDCTVEVCSLDSAESNYTLSGHSASIKCLDFFTWDDKEYLVTGSDDQTAKIWDMEQKICLCTLKVFTSPVIFVLCRSDLQILITCSQDGSIYMWRICSRVVLATKDAIAIMDIDCVNSREKSMEYSEPQLSADTRLGGDNTCKVIMGSSKELPILDVHPLELRSSEPNEPIMCSLHLTNKTDGHVAFRITEESRESLRCSSELRMYDIVPPRSTYTLDVTTGYKMKLDEETDFNLVVQSSISGERYITLFISQSECDEFFEEAEEIGNTVHEVTVKAIYAPHRDMASKYYNELHPLKHRFFYPELGESIACSLHLTNKTDEHVVFRLMKKGIEVEDYWRQCSYSLRPQYGVVPPRSTCTLVMTRKELAEETGSVLQKKETGSYLVLQSTISVDENILLRKDQLTCSKFFKKATKLGHVVYEVAVKADYTPRRGETTSELAVGPTILMKPVSLEYTETLCSLDAHPTEPWIVIGMFNGYVIIWNHESKTAIGSFEISEKAVWCVKFHATKNWIVAVTLDTFIHVYDCVCVTQIQKITSFRPPHSYNGYSVGVHPTKPYVVSASVEVWDGDKGWQCTHKFGIADLLQLAFNTEDPNSFASVPYDSYFVEVRSLDSSEPYYTLNGHSDRVNCLDFFKGCDRWYLITGSDDCTAKIWDLQKRMCIHTIEGLVSPAIHVISIPGRPYLVTCLKNATIHVWSSTNFSGEEVRGLVCLMGSRSVAIGQLNAISIMDIDDDEEAVSSEGNNEDSECAAGESSNS